MARTYKEAILKVTQGLVQKNPFHLYRVSMKKVPASVEIPGDEGVFALEGIEAPHFDRYPYSHAALTRHLTSKR